MSAGGRHLERLRAAWVDPGAGGRIHFTAAFGYAEVAETAWGSQFSRGGFAGESGPRPGPGVTSASAGRRHRGYGRFTPAGS
jgi:hypothetical protein